MKTGYFLIPRSYSSKNLPLDYSFCEHTIDRRTRFWRINQYREVSAAVTVAEAETQGMRVFRDDNGAVCRILAPDGKTAKRFHDRMVLLGYVRREA